MDEKIKGAFAKVTTHPDGSRSFYEESKDKTLVVQKNFSSDGKLTFVSSFKFDSGKNPRIGKIESPSGKILIKIRYAYHRDTGRLLHAVYYDMTKKRINSKTGEIQPIQIVVHEYDSDGNALTPKSVALVPKHEFEKIIGAPLGNAGLVR